MIYEMRCYDISPDKRSEFLDKYGKINMPVFEKLGAKVIGVWETIIGDRNQLITLFAFDDMSKCMEFWENFRRDRAHPTFPRFHNSLTTSILRPTEYSPLK